MSLNGKQVHQINLIVWVEHGVKAGADSTSGVDADLSKMRVLDAVIKETLRLHGPAPIGTVRCGVMTSHDALLLMHVPQSDDRNINEKKRRQGQRGEGGGGETKRRGGGGSCSQHDEQLEVGSKTACMQLETCIICTLSSEFAGVCHTLQ